MKTNVNLCKTTIFYCFFAVEDLESKLPVTYPKKNERQIDCKFETYIAHTFELEIVNQFLLATILFFWSTGVKLIHRNFDFHQQDVI